MPLSGDNRAVKQEAEGPAAAEGSSPGQSGPTKTLGSISGRHDLAPWLVLASVFPLGVVLRHRNFCR
jgi:hypothetical protein